MPPFFVENYLPVHQTDSLRESEDGEELLKHPSTGFSSRNASNNSGCSTWFVWIHRFFYILVPCLILSNWYAWSKFRSVSPANKIFSPAESAVKHETVVFSAGIEGETTPYQGWPNEENNQLWEDLYNFGVSRIPMSDAAQLANRTSPIPNEPGEYVVILSVFHQLHCLNHLRKRIFWKGAEPPSDDDPAVSLRHMDHCIDLLRQSLMCSADITPLPYVWWSNIQLLSPTTRVQHTCRDFSAIQEWARQRKAPNIDSSKQVDDPLGKVEFTPGQ